MKKTLLSLAVVSLLSADTTMCFKKNHLDPSTIDDTALDGGKCASKLSSNDMKKDGYIVEDIKITANKNSMDFIYVFKKPTSVQVGANGVVLTDAALKARLRKINEEVKVEEKKKKEKELAVNGEKLYKDVCASCHGQNAEVSAYNVAQPLNTMSVDEIEFAINEYNVASKDKGMAIIMKPYAAKYSSQEIKSVATYIQSLK
jgi:cytochrome c553